MMYNERVVMSVSEYKSQQELYQELIPALNVKLRLLQKSEYHYITREDIWNCLKETKWVNSVDLTLGEMVSDIIRIDNQVIDLYLKNKLKNEKKEIIV